MKRKMMVVTKGTWKPTESALTSYIKFLSEETQLERDKAERVVIALTGGKLTHRGFIRGVKAAVKAGHAGMAKYLPQS